MTAAIGWDMHTHYVDDYYQVIAYMFISKLYQFNFHILIHCEMTIDSWVTH